MMWQLVAIVGTSSLLGMALWLASKNGSKAAQLEALKMELKKQAEEQERAQRIRERVNYMDEYVVRQRLHEIANRER